MLTPEQAKVLSHLHRHPFAPLDDVAARAGLSRGTTERVLADLEWFGYVVVYPGSPMTVEMTPAGMHCPV